MDQVRYERLVLGPKCVHVQVAALDTRCHTSLAHLLLHQRLDERTAFELESFCVHGLILPLQRMLHMIGRTHAAQVLRPICVRRMLPELHPTLFLHAHHLAALAGTDAIPAARARAPPLDPVNMLLLVRSAGALS